MTVSVTVRNAGSASVGPFSITLYLAPASPTPVPGDGVAIGGKPIPSLGPLLSLATTASLIVPANLAAGSYLLSAVADADNTIPELGGNDGATVNGRVVTKATTVQLSP